jgi:hypothetical protein
MAYRPGVFWDGRYWKGGDSFAIGDETAALGGGRKKLEQAEYKDFGWDIRRPRILFRANSVASILHISGHTGLDVGSRTAAYRMLFFSLID